MTQKDQIKKASLSGKAPRDPFKEHKVLTKSQEKATKPPAPVKATGGKNMPVESGGPQGPEPTRYGDWERKGICVDF